MHKNKKYWISKTNDHFQNLDKLQKFKDKENFLETWKSAIKYPMRRELARETLALFGSTYQLMCANQHFQR